MHGTPGGYDLDALYELWFSDGVAFEVNEVEGNGGLRFRSAYLCSGPGAFLNQKDKQTGNFVLFLVNALGRFGRIR